MWDLKYDTNELIYKQKQTHRLVVAKGEGVGGGLEWEAGVRGCRLLYVEWIHNRVLLCSTENYI